MKSINRRLTTVAIAGAVATLMLGCRQQGSMAQTVAPSTEFHRFTPSTLRVDPESSTAEAPGASTLIGARRGRLGLVLTARRRPLSTIAPTASTHRGRHSTRSTRTRSCRCVPSTTIVSSSRKSKVSPMDSGPTFNAQACRECHQNIVTGGASQMAEHRTGRIELLQFVESVGGSLIQSRSTHPDIFERVPFEDSVSTLRISTNTLGCGVHRGHRESTLAGHSRPATRVDPWQGAGSGGARGQQRAAHRAFWVEEPACEPGVVRCGCLSERNGHHHAGLAGREHLAGPVRRVWYALRSGPRSGG